MTQRLGSIPTLNCVSILKTVSSAHRKRSFRSRMASYLLPLLLCSCAQISTDRPLQGNEVSRPQGPSPRILCNPLCRSTIEVR